MTDQLKGLLLVAKQTRDAAGYSRMHRAHVVTESQWQAFCKQIKLAEKALEQD